MTTETNEYHAEIIRGTIPHMDKWLDEQISGDANRAAVRAAMVVLLESDPEWWSCQSYWNWIDNGIDRRSRDIANGRIDLRDNE